MGFDLSRLANTPATQEDIINYLREGIPALIEAIAELDNVFDKTDVAPERPQEGTIRYADGTNWNPGSGAGLYRYTSAVWVLIMGSGGAGAYAPLASPTFTGDPKGPTPAAGDNDTSLATSAFVNTIFAAPPALGSTTPAAATFTTLLATLLTLSTDPSGTPAASTLYKTSIPKAWIRFNMATDAIADSFNVSSITDGAAGTDTIVFDLDFANANYASAGHALQVGVLRLTACFESQAVGSVIFSTIAHDATAPDATAASAIFSGDQ